jgi:hypothetical protein
MGRLATAAKVLMLVSALAPTFNASLYYTTMTTTVKGNWSVPTVSAQQFRDAYQRARAK